MKKLRGKKLAILILVLVLLPLTSLMALAIIAANEVNPAKQARVSTGNNTKEQSSVNKEVAKKQNTNVSSEHAQPPVIEAQSNPSVTPNEQLAQISKKARKAKEIHAETVRCHAIDKQQYNILVAADKQISDKAFSDVTAINNNRSYSYEQKRSLIEVVNSHANAALSSAYSNYASSVKAQGCTPTYGKRIPINY